ncbi:MAG: hypothetical protein L6406_04125 [Desulfobacterales bacterium]|nr:hypothetical protein [Desulfobacterales bacterium]
MMISATYICPVKGLTSLEPPEPARLGQVARVAKNLGLERLLLPVLEESLLKTSRARVSYLEGLIKDLDQVSEAGLTAWLIAPAQRLLGLDWVPPHLVKAVRDPKAGRVFLEGRLRNLWPYNWWNDLSILQKRLKIFRELVAAVLGHPALTGWLIMDRALEWSRPDTEVANLVLKSYMAEIRERDESGSICMGLGWSELLNPEMAQVLTQQVDGVRMSGLESLPQGLNSTTGLAGELLMASYLGALSQWIFGRPIEVEVGWGLSDKAGDPEEISEAGKRLAGQSLAGVIWLSLIGPEPRLHTQPPWGQWPGLERVGLLGQDLEPKEWVEPLLKEIRTTETRHEVNDFIDLSPEEYLVDPQTHLFRLWEHFRESN